MVFKLSSSYCSECLPLVQIPLGHNDNILTPNYFHKNVEFGSAHLISDVGQLGWEAAWYSAMGARGVSSNLNSAMGPAGKPCLVAPSCPGHLSLKTSLVW